MIDYEALLRTGVEVHILDGPKESNSTEKEHAHHSPQKKPETGSENVRAKMSNEAPEQISDDYYSVQVAALSDVLTAHKMANQLGQEGFPAFVEQTEGKNSKVLFRIRVGRYDSRIDAEKTLEQLVKSGRTGFVSKQ